MKDGVFREDLFHRLNVIRLRLPALRERHEDVPMLTRHFLQQSARQLGVEPKRIADAALARLEQFSFPGNVRQLENICHWLTVMAPAQVISAQDLPPEVLDAPLIQAQSLSGGVAAPAGLTVPDQHLQAGAAHVADYAAAAPVPAATAFAQGVAPGALSAPVAPVSHPVADGMPATLGASAAGVQAGWEQALEAEAQRMLLGGQAEVWDALTRRFESRLIRTALHATHGRRMEAAQRLGIGRNTITRKIQELGLDAPDEA